MKLFNKKVNSIQSSLLLHELSYVLLILITVSVGIAWSYAWQNSAEESIRLTTMNSHVQNIRSELYRQLKEVFDAVFLHDEDAAKEYDHYTHNIHQYLDALSKLNIDPLEAQAINKIGLAYASYQDETNRLLKPVNLTAEQRYLLDKQLERFTFSELELAFRQLEGLISQKQQSLNDNRTQWVNRLLLLGPVPVLLAVLLLFFSRRYVRQNVLHPLSNVMSGARIISKGDLQHAIPTKGVEELRKLAEAINVMAADLSENRDMLVEAKKQAALGELVPLVAHNIRNPLAGIRAASQVTLDEPVSEPIQDALKDIIIAVDRLERWVTSLLTYLHPLHPHFVEARLIDVADEVISMMQLQLAEKDITVEKSGWDSEATRVLLDINLFEQTLFNLLQNAIEASPSQTTLIIQYQQDRENVILSITDQGIGMTFDPVTEEVIDGETKRLSCGLGIPFALKVIKQHGGSIVYQSLKPTGTKVTIILPSVFNLPDGKLAS